MTTTAYSIVSHDGEPMLETKVTDALGRNAESYTDEKGRNRETVQHASGDNITVKYDYDAVGQVTTVHHPNDKTTTYEYDLLGHKLKVNHPDAGEVSYTYDAAGNLLTKLTAELKKRISADAPITYTYDYERLSEVLYPKNLFNRVTYTYGKPGEKYNRAGRLVLVEDASGGEAYYYGNQGEVVKTVRSVMVSTADVRTYVYGATYDSWNRVRTMTYPDGEVVTYHYNAAGKIVGLSGNKQGRESVIVDRIGYDKDGHTVYTKLGNGTVTTYTYDKQRERLQAMNLTADGRAVMENKYQYDAVDNILGIANAVDPTQAASNNNSNNNKAKLGGAFNYTYAYDDLNRLIKANGEAKCAKYEMTMTFGRMSEPLTKVQKVDSTKTAQSYDFTYQYEDSNHPTAPTQIGHEHYTYDANGNPTLVENDSLNTERRMYWDEDNRLMVLSDNGKTSRYTYNAAGERIVKSHGDLEGVYVNGAPQGITADFVDFRLRLGKTSELLFHSACTEVPRDGGLHHLSCPDYHRDEEPLYQALLRRRQAHCLQTGNRQVQQCLRHQQQQRYGRPERLCRPNAADRKTARGVLPQAGHTARCSYDEGCNGRPRQHGLWLQHHHRRAGRPLCARRLGATAEVQ